MKYCYVIGDSFFSAEPNNWLEQGIPEDYTVVNQAIGATGFWRQLQQVKDLYKSQNRLVKNNKTGVYKLYEQGDDVSSISSNFTKAFTKVEHIIII